MESQLDTTLRFHQQALNLRAYRSQLLASNIANADTPNYKAKDIDFASAMQGALSRQQPGNPGLVLTSMRHITSAAENMAGVRVMHRVPYQSSLDGNTVNMDVERAQFADNAIRYEASLTFISNQIKTLLSAIQG